MIATAGAEAVPLAVRDLSLSFGGIQVLHDIAIHVMLVVLVRLVTHPHRAVAPIAAQ